MKRAATRTGDAYGPSHALPSSVQSMACPSCRAKVCWDLLVRPLRVLSHTAHIQPGSGCFVSPLQQLHVMSTLPRLLRHATPASDTNNAALATTLHCTPLHSSSLADASQLARALPNAAELITDSKARCTALRLIRTFLVSIRRAKYRISKQLYLLPCAAHRTLRALGPLGAGSVQPTSVRRLPVCRGNARPAVAALSPRCSSASASASASAPAPTASCHAPPAQPDAAVRHSLAPPLSTALSVALHPSAHHNAPLACRHAIRIEQSAPSHLAPFRRSLVCESAVHSAGRHQSAGGGTAAGRRERRRG